MTHDSTKPEDPTMSRGLMPPTLPIAEARFYPATAQVRSGQRWHTVPVEVVTIESARVGMVTVGLAGYFGEHDGHLYEVDLTPSAAEQLALRLVRRAHDIRTDQAEAGTAASAQEVD